MPEVFGFVSLPYAVVVKLLDLLDYLPGPALEQLEQLALALALVVHESGLAFEPALEPALELVLEPEPEHSQPEPVPEPELEPVPELAGLELELVLQH